MTDQDHNLIWAIEQYQTQQKEINKKLNKLKKLIKNSESNCEEALALRERIYYASKNQEVLMSELTVGTDDYDGVAYFWSGEYRHSGLREASKSKLKRVHKEFLKAGLELYGVSAKHEQIINKVLG